MIAFVGNWKLRTQVLLILFFPLIGLLLMGWNESIEKYRVTSDMERFERVAALSVKVSGLVHELQKERGLTSGFLTSKGQAFVAELKSQRATVDLAMGGVATGFEALEADGAAEKSNALARLASEELKKMVSKRQQVDGLQVAAGEATGYFTGTISKLLDIVPSLGELTTNPAIDRAVQGYFVFMQAKERAGRERAAGTAGFAAGHMNFEQMLLFRSLGADQDTYLRVFGMLATPAQKEALAKTVSGPVVDEVVSLRRIALESFETGSVHDVSASHWFDVSTARIELFHKMEESLSTDLAALVAGVHRAASSAFYGVLALTLGLLAISFVVGWSLMRGFSNALGRLCVTMERLSGGDLDVEIADVEKTNEVGTMARAVQVFKDNALKVRQIATEQEAMKQQAAEEQKRVLNALADSFESSVKTVVEAVSSASTEMQVTAEGMLEASRQTECQTEQVASAAHEASDNVQTVASAAEELSASIAEISAQISQSSRISQDAVSEAARANDMIGGLAVAVGRIDEIVALINDIAGQTNLLALNATIEAARAGEAGKGFAVVANEVKNLANQTAKATSEIGGQIADIQTATNDAVTAIRDIGGVIEQISDIGSAVADGIAQQGAATHEIARNVQSASGGTQQVSNTILDVNRAVVDSSEAAKQFLDAASELSRQSEMLRSEVDKFIVSIRA